MNTPAQGESTKPEPTRRTDFSKLTKAQLVARLTFAEGGIISQRDYFRAEGAKPEPYLWARSSERGFANAMEQALQLIAQDPDEWRSQFMND
jgi:hypothetical protein